MLKSPFPYFGGKSRVAPEVWERFGPVKNYIEPFFGSGSVLLANPNNPFPVETVNDKDSFIANVMRSLQKDPVQVAYWADQPVNEVELHCRHNWLREQFKGDLGALLLSDPEFYDPKIAGLWLWGITCWIGWGWCSSKRSSNQIPFLSSYGMGYRALAYRDKITEYFVALSGRLKYVRVCCGEWDRILGPSVTTRHGLTGVFLDPPYSAKERTAQLYAVESDGVAQKAARWAIENGDNPLLRIALCGYDTEHTFPDNWTAFTWKANGGYGNASSNRGRANAGRETIWFSPHCLIPGQEASLCLK